MLSSCRKENRVSTTNHLLLNLGAAALVYIWIRNTSVAYNKVQFLAALTTVIIVDVAVLAVLIITTFFQKRMGRAFIK